eukprot:m.45493 g.45493  ORF g.45493 m.45493 type:complete len:327 (-) comp11784_c0_seq2:33-1013(-)
MLLQLGSRFLTTTAVVAGLRATVQGALRRFTTTTMANTGVGDVGAVVAAARAASIDGLQAANLKRRLLAGEKLYGAGSVTCCNSAVELLALSGFDFVVIDLEHGPGDIQYAQSALQTLEGTGTSGLVRVPGHDPVFIKKALGVGAKGIVVPSVETPEQAQAVIDAFHYVPHGGVRGAGWGAERGGRYGLRPDYPHKVSDETLFVLMIETPRGHDNIEKIAAIPGFDMLMIGPLDLATSMGTYERVNDDVVAMVSSIEKKTLASGKLLGAGAVVPRSTAKEMFERGYNLVWGCNDIGLLREAALANVKAIKGDADCERLSGSGGDTC